MLPESLYNTPGKPSRSDFHTAVLPVLTCLAPYHAHLDPQLQQRIIKCMKFGLGKLFMFLVYTYQFISTLYLTDVVS